MQCGSPNGQWTIWIGFYGASVFENQPRFFDNFDQFSGNKSCHLSYFSEHESALSVAWRNNADVNPIVSDCLPGHARSYNVRLTTLSGPSEGDKLPSIPEEPFLVWGWLKSEEAFAEFYRVSGNLSVRRPDLGSPHECHVQAQ